MEALTARLAGRRHYPALLEARSEISLVHDRTNPVDRNAVEVHSDGEMVGYLESGLALMVAPRLDRGRPVYASAIPSDQAKITVYILGRGDRVGRNLVSVTSSRGRRGYVVDRRRKVPLCTCPAGRYAPCRHKKALGLI